MRDLFSLKKQKQINHKDFNALTVFQHEEVTITAGALGGSGDS